MNAWAYLIILTCAYGGIKSVQPTTPFLTQYLEGPWMNLTHTQVTNQVYPVWTYSYLCFLPIIFITTVYVRHKPILILESVSLVATFALLLWGRSLWAVQVMQVVYSVASACEVGYDTYIYAKVSRSKYRQATSYTFAAVLVGKLISAVTAQLVISTRLLDYRDLNYISLSFSACAFILALFLPTTKTSGFELEIDDEGVKSTEENTPVNLDAVSSNLGQNIRDKRIKTQVGTSKGKSRCIFLFRLWMRIRKSYSERSIREWSVWWALGMCGSLQVGNYIQTLWEEIYPLKYNQDLYNGAVDAVKTFLGALVTLALGHVRVDWSRYGELTMAIASALNACVLFVMSNTGNIFVAYVTYCAFRVSHQMVLTIARFQVAKGLSQTNQPLVFGCNTFLALLFQTLLTVIVVDKKGLGLSPRLQFVVYAGFFTCISAFFSVLTTGRFFIYLYKLKFLSPTPTLETTEY